jgi:[ribosomal protein S18]-alanine N-acetyltransferase
MQALGMIREFEGTSLSGERFLELAALEAAAFEHPWTAEQLSGSPGLSRFLVDGEDTKPRGYLLYSVAADEAELLRVAVRPEHRGRGIAGRLVEACLESCRNRGIRRIFLEVNERNAPAIRVYERAGFSTIAVRKKYYDANAAIIYKKELI